MPPLPRPPQYFVEKLTTLGRQVRDAVITARRKNAAFAGVSKHTSADTIYQLDTHVEPVLEAFCDSWSRELPLVLIAEGIEGPDGTEGLLTFPRGSDPASASFRLIVDPIDGTRGLMYDKRSAWFLAGVAPNHGPNTRLQHITIAVQVEVPTSKQNVSDVLWATKGGGAHAQRDTLPRGGSQKDSGQSPLRPESFQLSPSSASTLAHGFATVSNFFPGTKRLAADLMERIVEKTIGAADVTKAMVFDDQYISTGGQFYELMVGHDRFTADLRPIFYQLQNQPPGLCVHPYDVVSMLIATEAGILLTDGLGNPLDGPLDTETPLAFSAFANQTLRAQIEPVILNFLQEKRH